MKHEFYYTSRDSVTKIHAIEWIPDGEVKGILQICHGMVEYIDRYDEFAKFINKPNFTNIKRLIKNVLSKVEKAGIMNRTIESKLYRTKLAMRNLNN